MILDKIKEFFKIQKHDSPPDNMHNSVYIARIGNFIEYWENDGRHRIDGPAIYNLEEVHEEWWFENQRHRIGGPAVIVGQHEEWWLNGQLHRDDGPAITTSELLNDTWYYNGTRLPYDINDWIIENNIQIPMNEEHKLLFKIRWL